MLSKVVDYVKSPYTSDEQRTVGNTFDMTDTFISFKEVIICCKVDNEWII